MKLVDSTVEISKVQEDRMKRVIILATLCVLFSGHYLKSRDFFKGAQEARVGFGPTIAENDFIKKCIEGLEADDTLRAKILEKNITEVQMSEFLNESCKCLWKVAGTASENLAAAGNSDSLYDHMRKTVNVPTPENTRKCIDDVFYKFNK